MGRGIKARESEEERRGRRGGRRRWLGNLISYSLLFRWIRDRNSQYEVNLKPEPEEEMRFHGLGREVLVCMIAQ